jgi:hypothetical protein
MIGAFLGARRLSSAARPATRGTQNQRPHSPHADHPICVGLCVVVGVAVVQVHVPRVGGVVRHRAGGRKKHRLFVTSQGDAAFPVPGRLVFLLALRSGNKLQNQNTRAVRQSLLTTLFARVRTNTPGTALPKKLGVDYFKSGLNTRFLRVNSTQPCNCLPTSSS